MSVVGGTFVGGSSSGWEIADPNANAHALGLVAAPTVATVATVATPVYGGGTYATAFGTPVVTNPATSFGMPTAGAYNPYGGGYVGGSWSPEPVGNNQILYGHYSSQGMLALPQAFYGQQASTGYTGAPIATAPATTTTSTATTSTATTTAGGQPAKPTAATDTKAADPKKPAADEATATEEKKKPVAKKPVTVKAGDTLSEIAAKHGTTWQELYKLNKAVVGSDPNLIKPGQELKLP